MAGDFFNLVYGTEQQACRCTAECMYCPVGVAERSIKLNPHLGLNCSPLVRMTRVVSAGKQHLQSSFSNFLTGPGCLVPFVTPHPLVCLA